MADRYDSRSMVDYLAGKLPPGTTIDDAGQLVFRDTGEPVKANPWKLQRLLQIVGMAVPMSRAASTATAAVPTSTAEAGMNVANRVAPSLGRSNATTAIAGPPPAALAAPAARELAGPSERAVSEVAASRPAMQLPQSSPSALTTAMEPRAVDPGSAILRPPSSQPPAAMPNSDVLPPPRLVGESAAGDRAAEPWVTGSRTNVPPRAAPPAAALSHATPGATPAAAARAMALQVLSQKMNNPSASATPQAPRTIFNGQQYQMPGGGNGSQFSRQLPSDYQPAQAAPAPAPAARPVPLPPRRPAELTPQHRSDASPDYQSNSRQVVDNGRINWGSDDSAADFFRASKALQNDPTLTALARGGTVHPAVAHALALIKRHLGIAVIGAFLVLGPLYALFSAGPALAHDKWWNGKEVDPITKLYCCGDNDVLHLTREQVKIVKDGYQLVDTGEFIPYSRAQPSVDGEYWVFRWGYPKKTQCFFAPFGGS